MELCSIKILPNGVSTHPPDLAVVKQLLNYSDQARRPNVSDYLRIMQKLVL